MTSLTDTQVVTASGGLVELGYLSHSGTVTVTSGSNSYIGNTLTCVCDGSPVLVEVYVPRVDMAATGDQWIQVEVDGVSQGRTLAGYNPGGSSAVGSTHGCLRITPSAGSHTFRMRAYSYNATTSYLAGGGVFSDAFLRVSKIVQATQWPAVTTGVITCTSLTRPSAPVGGMLIWEADNTRMMVYVSGAGWHPVTTPALSVEYLVVAGGGQGGGSQGQSIASGGGGAGGMLTNRLTGTRLQVVAGTAYTVTVGTGGTNASTGFYQGSAGGNSVFATVTATGGGGGGTWQTSPGSGGSGGGAGENGQGIDGGAGTAGQGYRGGNDMQYDSGGVSVGAGGGGAGGAGGNVDWYGGLGGDGGDGRPCDITGSWVTYSGGGGGGGNVLGGKGGDGGGAAGRGGSTGAGGDASANTGGGGGGSLTNANEAAQRGGYGGSGVVVVRYPAIFPAATVTGSPTVTTVGDDRVYRWTSTGTWSITF